LGRSILHGDAVRRKVNVRSAALEGLLGLALPEVRVENFFRKRQGTAQYDSGGVHFGFVSGVKRLNHVKVKNHNRRISAKIRRESGFLSEILQEFGRKF
jgi:hypothetical protein